MASFARVATAALSTSTGGEAAEAIEQAKRLLRERGLSVATPGLAGAARLGALKRRLADALQKEAKEDLEAKRLTPNTRLAAFRSFRTAQATRRLEVAIGRGDAKSIVAAIRCGADPNKTCRAGILPLHNAIECGDVELVEVLVRAGADVNAKSTYCTDSLSMPSMTSAGSLHDSSVETITSSEIQTNGATPLVLACLLDNFDMVALLLRLGADASLTVDVYSHRGVCALAIAVCRDDVPTATALLNAPATRYWVDERGRAPLMYAARCGSAGCVKLLLDRGFDPHAIDYDGRNALDWAQLLLTAPPASLDPSAIDVTAVVQLLLPVSSKSWRTVHYGSTADPTEASKLLDSFPVDDLVDVPPTRCSLTRLAPLQLAPNPVDIFVGPASVDGTRATPVPPIPMCEHCQAEARKVRCHHCEQEQCERCCVALHQQESRRHHRIKPLKSLYSAEEQQLISLVHQPASTLAHSVGVARRALAGIRETLDESPMGTLTQLREMETRVAVKDALKDKRGARRRSSARVSLPNLKRGSDGDRGNLRRKSDVLVAKEIAVRRAREKIRLLYQSAPELELVEFYMVHGKLAEAETVLREFTEDLTGKVSLDDSLWLRVHAMHLQLRSQQQLWGAAVNAGTNALAVVVDDSLLCSSEVTAVVSGLASALVELKDLQHAAEVYKSCALRLLRCEPTTPVRAALVTYMERYDVIHADWELAQMALEDTLASASGSASSEPPVAIVPSEAELFTVLLNSKWAKCLRRLCKLDGTLASIRFIIDVREYRSKPKDTLPAIAAELVRKFIKNPSILPVLPMVVKNRLQANLKTQTLVTSFDECDRIVIDSVVRGPLARFLQSKDGQRYTRHRRKLDDYDKAAAREAFSRATVAGGGADVVSGAVSIDGVGDSEAAETGEEPDDMPAVDVWGVGVDGIDAAAAATDPMLAQRFLKRFDFESGFPYFVDLETGETTWDVPHPFHSEWEIPYRVVCVECDATFANHHCVECDLSYCEACFVATHARGPKRQHRYMPLRPDEPVCAKCVSRFGMRHCLECDTVYCTDCLVDMHSEYPYSGHTWSSTEFTTMEEETKSADIPASLFHEAHTI